MRRDAELETIIAVKYSAIADALDERGRRLWAASGSSAIGYGVKRKRLDALQDTIDQLVGEIS